MCGAPACQADHATPHAPHAPCMDCMGCVDCMQVVPRTLSENSGLNAYDAVQALYAAHAQGQTQVRGGAALQLLEPLPGSF